MATDPHPRDRQRTTRLERITVRMPHRLIEDLDALVDAGEYSNRSEAVRDTLATALEDNQS